MALHERTLRTARIAAASAFIALSACGQKPPPAAPQPPEVSVVTVRRGAVPLSLELPGLNYHSRRPGLFLELSGEAVLPLIRQEYFVASPSRGAVFVHKNPPFSMRGAASLGVRFL